MMTATEASIPQDTGLASSLGLPSPHFERLCRAVGIGTGEGELSVEEFASRLGLPELVAAFGKRVPLFLAANNVARSLGLSERSLRNLARASGRGSPLRQIRISERVRYFYAPDVDRLLFGDRTEIAMITDDQRDAEGAENHADASRTDAEFDVLLEDLSFLEAAMSSPTRERKK